MVINMTIQSSLAKYILDLSESAAATHRAEDRPIYESYLADAAVLLAAVVAGKDKEEIEQHIERHERLWGQTWHQDPVYKKPAESFKKFKDIIGYKTI